MGDAEFRLNLYDEFHIETVVLSKLENKHGKIFEKLSTSKMLSMGEVIERLILSSS